MRILFEFDFKNYKENGTVAIRPSARGIIYKNGKLAMAHSKKYGYYKFPGGGINKSESKIDALIREVREEAGLVVIKDSIKEYGYVLRKEKGKFEDLFIQENYYYLCDVEDNQYPLLLEKDEQEDGFEFIWIEPNIALDTNILHSKVTNDNIIMHMIERETRVLELLIKELF